MKAAPVVILILAATFGSEALAEVIIRHAPLSAKSPPTSPAVDLLVEVPFWLIATSFLIVMNAVAFGMFAWDKWCSRRGHRRVSESNLLLTVIIGGSVGAIVAQQCLRHKTHKEPFRTILYGIAVVQGLVLLAMLYQSLRQIVEEFVNRLL